MAKVLEDSGIPAGEEDRQQESVSGGFVSPPIRPIFSYVFAMVSILVILTCGFIGGADSTKNLTDALLSMGPVIMVVISIFVFVGLPICVLRDA